MGRYGRTGWMYSKSKSQKVTVEKAVNEVIRKCTETPLKARQNEQVSEYVRNERKYEPNERKRAMGAKETVHLIEKGRKIRA